ncbi:KH domain-containing protein [Thermosynechococcaceae cyanobacterium BACA0444]|uniref:KH domain-containing protein n=1 Tax=Pseudocalidococcus azoricus BACA0444 TaxID=2918990 RepID=A0AAE4FPS7_9CYAN|nr:KH domain-containing protein [Pseudocalidococcus azoricus]MDS3859509.1 KH domain-containing protein [Pseudocalidococcus azoricus BACA0444]
MTVAVSVDYRALVEFLLTPFLDTPQALRVHTELRAQNTKAWIRVAFDPTDKGRVLGRGGRTIQAIRAIVEAAGQTQGQQAYLEVFGERDFKSSSRSREPDSESSKRRPHRDHPRPTPRRQS